MASQEGPSQPKKKKKLTRYSDAMAISFNRKMFKTCK